MEKGLVYIFCFTSPFLLKWKYLYEIKKKPLYKNTMKLTAILYALRFKLWKTSKNYTNVDRSSRCFPLHNYSSCTRGRCFNRLWCWRRIRIIFILLKQNYLYVMTVYIVHTIILKNRSKRVYYTYEFLEYLKIQIIN